MAETRDGRGDRRRRPGWRGQEAKEARGGRIGEPMAGARDGRDDQAGSTRAGGARRPRELEAGASGSRWLEPVMGEATRPAAPGRAGRGGRGSPRRAQRGAASGGPWRPSRRHPDGWGDEAGGTREAGEDAGWARAWGAAQVECRLPRGRADGSQQQRAGRSEWGRRPRAAPQAALATKEGMDGGRGDAAAGLMRV